MTTVKEVELQKEGKMVTPVTIVDSVKNSDGTKYKDHKHDDRYYTKAESDVSFIKRITYEVPHVFDDGEVLGASTESYPEEFALYHHEYWNTKDNYCKSFKIDFQPVLNAGKKIIGWRGYAWALNGENIEWLFDNRYFTCRSTNNNFGNGTRMYLDILIM